MLLLCAALAQHAIFRRLQAARITGQLSSIRHLCLWRHQHIVLLPVLLLLLLLLLLLWRQRHRGLLPLLRLLPLPLLASHKRLLLRLLLHLLIRLRLLDLFLLDARAEQGCRSAATGRWAAYAAGAARHAARLRGCLSCHCRLSCCRLSC